MARMSGATWRPISVNYTKNGQDEVRGVVVHIMAGTLAGTDSWFRNRAAQASSHFGTGKAGQLYQWVDTKDRAWAQANGNRTWISVENEGKGGDSLTDAQLDRNAEVLAWAHKTHGVPLQVTSSPSGRGLGYHAMGGSAWGGHTSCPGTNIVAQLAEIVKRAKALVGGSSSGGSTSTTTKPKVSVAHLNQARAKDIPAATGHTTYPAEVKIVEAALKAEGLLSAAYAADGSWGTKTDAAFNAFRRKMGYVGTAATGTVGLASLKKLAARHGFTATT